MSDVEVKIPVSPKSVIFVHHAAKGQIANWIPERYEGNRLIPERSIVFEDNMFATDDKKKIAFIRKSSSAKSGMVLEMEDEAAANRWIELHLRAKEITSITSSDVSAADESTAGAGQ